MFSVLNYVNNSVIIIIRNRIEKNYRMEKHYSNKILESINFVFINPIYLSSKKITSDLCNPQISTYVEIVDVEILYLIIISFR